MKTVALISGGKDSCYNMMQCIGAGHTIVALANLQPMLKDELDSYMYQTVGHQGIELYADAMELPLYRELITGSALDQERNYKPSDCDEVEDLYRLLSRIKDDLDIEAVAVGAILSDYQRIRVENVCQRLGLVSLAYLWRRNQKELLSEMIASGVEAIIIKVAALGLDPRVHLGMSLRQIQPHLLVMQEKYGLNMCGEGGEYETFTLDCPLFKQRLVIDSKDLVMHSEDPVASVGYLNLKLHLEPKNNVEVKLPVTIKSPLDFVGDLSDTVFSDLSDIELSETELESLEALEKEKKKKELSDLLTSNEMSDAATGVDALDSQDDSTESLDDAYNYEEEHYDFENLPVVDHRSIYGNSHGWYFIGGIVGEGTDTGVATEDAMKKLISLLESEDVALQEVCSVNIYMRDMEDYSTLNNVYAKYFSFADPPTRVCVQCPLPDNVGLILDAVAYKAVPSADADSPPKVRSTMHVQSISHWAPANIGPYSQAFKVGEVVGTSGQIALVPGSMRLARGGTRRQCALALRHVGRVLRAAHPRAIVRSIVQAVCYVGRDSGGGGSGSGDWLGSGGEARRQLERRTAGAVPQMAVVGRLPRGAAVEWHAWAHADNNIFDYEETGCSVDDYKVAITRRWNCENTVAAFVCNVATGSPPPGELRFPTAEEARAHRSRAARLTARQLRAVLEYMLRRVLPDHGAGDDPPALYLRVFYQWYSGPGSEGIALAAAEAARSVGARAAVTCVPVLALHSAVTCLSVGGLQLRE